MSSSPPRFRGARGGCLAVAGRSGGGRTRLSRCFALPAEVATSSWARRRPGAQRLDGRGCTVSRSPSSPRAVLAWTERSSSSPIAARPVRLVPSLPPAAHAAGTRRRRAPDYALDARSAPAATSSRCAAPSRRSRSPADPRALAAGSEIDRSDRPTHASTRTRTSRSTSPSWTGPRRDRSRASSRLPTRRSSASATSTRASSRPPPGPRSRSATHAVLPSTRPPVGISRATSAAPLRHPDGSTRSARRPDRPTKGVTERPLPVQRSGLPHDRRRCGGSSPDGPLGRASTVYANPWPLGADPEVPRPSFTALADRTRRGRSASAGSD